MRIVGVTGGVDTHADTHVAAAVDQNGGLLGIESFGADEVGYGELLDWLCGLSGRLCPTIVSRLIRRFGAILEL